MRRVALILLVLLVVGAGVYLNRAYAHFFSTIHDGNLLAPSGAGSAVMVYPDRPLTPSEQKSFLVYVALGDSLTAGAGVNTTSEIYAYKIAKLIADKNKKPVKLINLGMVGARTSDVLNIQVPELLKLSAQGGPAYAGQPDLVTILIGINDVHNWSGSLSDYSVNLEKIIAKVKTAKPKQIVIGTVPFLGDRQILWSPYDWYFAMQTKRYSDAVKLAASDAEIFSVDLGETFGARWRTSEYYARDHFHLNELGYTIIANNFYALINR